ncbi:protease [Egyptian fruit bat adenovirus]|uniref:Protease n=1 Tax=Egyptian fruit bat adenovirus TaxID=2849732 RepID=A0A344X9V2_9ADEN|nr:protease [Rousettus aegyptiacus adenovirus]AXE75634.1 protease [Egyptian fruit bat adenovirus]
MGSSETELRLIIKDLGVSPYFLGTFDKTFPGFIKKESMCCAIVNTALRSTGGVHWMAFGWYPPTQTFYMFEPFGFSDEKLKQIYNYQYEALLKNSAIYSTSNRCITLVKSNETVQGIHSAACGLFCVFFLYSFVNFPTSPMKNKVMDLITSVPNKEANNPINEKVLFQNQENMYDFLSLKSKYFRNHQNEIKAQTAFNKI